MRTTALLCLLGLAACSPDSATVTRQRALVPSLDSHLRTVSATGEVHTVIQGSPFAQAPDGSAILAAMPSAASFPHLRYVPSRPAMDPYGYRLVVAFGGGPAECHERGPAPAPAANVTEVRMVLCLGTSALGDAAGRTAPIAEPNDPRLARLLNSTVGALFSVAYRLAPRP